MIEIAEQVFVNWDQEAIKEAEKKQKENDKKSHQKVLLAAALGCQDPNKQQAAPPQWNPRTPGPWTSLQQDQCARCHGFGHWKNDCPLNKTKPIASEPADTLIGMAGMDSE